MAAIVPVLIVPAAGYTAPSNWINTIVRDSPAYPDLMPVANPGGVEIGRSPPARWFVIPPAARWLARFLPERTPGT